MATELEIHEKGKSCQWLEFIDDDMNTLTIESKDDDGDIEIKINDESFIINKKHMKVIIKQLS